MGSKDGNNFVFDALGRVDLRRTSLRRIGHYFLIGCRYLTAVTLPPSLTVVGNVFLGYCSTLQSVDMGHTALHTVGRGFAYNCPRLTTVVLLDSVTKVDALFLRRCDRAEVKSGSTAVQEAATAKRNC